MQNTKLQGVYRRDNEMTEPLSFYSQVCAFGWNWLPMELIAMRQFFISICPECSAASMNLTAPLSVGSGIKNLTVYGLLKLILFETSLPLVICVFGVCCSKVGRLYPQCTDGFHYDHLSAQFFGLTLTRTNEPLLQLSKSTVPLTCGWGKTIIWLYTC